MLKNIFITCVAACLSIFSINAHGQAVTFSYVGSAQNYTVPAGATVLTVDVYGAQGGSTYYGYAGGFGGRVQARIAVTPGQVLQVNVGQKGLSATVSLPGNPGGWNGGGNGTAYGGAGGGASDIRVSPYGIADRLVVAGGGGGGAQSCVDNGGAGGGTNGVSGTYCGAYTTADCGAGGTQTSGGAGATSGGAGTGSAGTGGSAAHGGYFYYGFFGTYYRYYYYNGGGGGGGYYGGGGGQNGSGGGGSSYPVTGATTTYVSAVTDTGAVNVGDGMIIITPLGSPVYYSTTSGGDASILTNWWSSNYDSGLHPTGFSGTNTTWVFQSNMTSTAPLTFTGNVSIVTGGTFTPLSASTTTVGGNWSNTGGTFSANGGTVAFNGANSASSDTLSGTMTGSNAFNNLTFSSPTNSYTFLSNPADVNGDFVHSSGAVTAPSGNLTVTGNFNHTGGTFAPNGGTLIKNGASTTLTVTGMTTAGTNCLNNLTLNATSPATYTISDNLLMTGNFTNTNANATMELGSNTLTVGGNWSNPGPFTTGAGHNIIYNKTGSAATVSGKQ